MIKIKSVDSSFSALAVFVAMAGMWLVLAPAYGATDNRAVAVSTPVVTDPETQFAHVSVPVINNSGQVAFRAYSPGASQFELDYSLWSEGSGPLQLVARTGVPPVADSDPLYYFGDPQINESGQVAFHGTTSIIPGTELRRHGIWLTDGNALRTIATTGQPTARTRPNTFFAHQTFSFLRLNNAGEVAYLGLFFNGQPSSPLFWQGYDAIWKTSAGAETIVTTDLPGLSNLPVDYPQRAILGISDYEVLQFNNVGEMAIAAAVTGPNVAPGTSRTIWRAGASGFQQIVREGDPTTAAGAIFFRSVSGQVLNNAGRIAFWAATMDPAVGFDTYRSGIWADDGLGRYPVIRTNDIAPDANGATFTGMGYPQIDDAGGVAFWAQVSTGGTGLWRVGGAGSRMVARQGELAPGTNATFGDFSGMEPVVNASGQVAFWARLGGLGLAPPNSSGLWALDRHGELQLIAKTGDPLEVAMGDVRTISQLLFVADGFNDLGQLAFQAEFTDGTSGAFVSNVAAIPEPGIAQLTLMAVGSLAFACRLRRM